MRNAAIYLASACAVALTILTVGFVGALGISEPAIARCNANSNVSARCEDDFVNAAKATVGADNDSNKAQSVGEAIRNCWNCAADKVEDLLNGSGGSGSGGGSSATR
jgi:hypothetical protein